MAWTDLSYLDINLAGKKIGSAMYKEGAIHFTTDDMDIIITCQEEDSIYGTGYNGSLNVKVEHHKKEEIII